MIPAVRRRSRLLSLLLLLFFVVGGALLLSNNDHRRRPVKPGGVAAAAAMLSSACSRQQGRWCLRHLVGRRQSPAALGYYSPSSKPPFASLSSSSAGLQHQQEQGDDDDTDGPPPPSLRRLEELEAEIAKLNSGRKINVNSPRQVSAAVFGRVQSANRTALREAAEGRRPVVGMGVDGGDDDDDLVGISSTQRQIAALVLAHRELLRGPGPAAQQKQAKRKSAERRVSTAATAAAESALIEPEEAEGMEKRQAADENSDGAALTCWGIDQRTLGGGASSQEDYLSSYDRLVESLFASSSSSSSKSKVHSYWKEPLLQLTRPTARALVYQLDAQACPMGYNPLAAPRDPLRRRVGGGDATNTVSTTTTTTTAGKKGSFLAYCRDQKNKYPDAVVLTRCGDFYETYGIDAIMLVEHCGLNAMAGKAKAGCPIRNVQATLDCLTAQGFRVAVYEEAADTDAAAARASGGSKSRIKNRFLAQIVSAAAPTYLYDLVLLANADALVTAPPSRPHVGVLSLSSGYTVVEISTEEQSVRVSERLTAEGVACRLAAYPPADPLFYVPSMSEYESSPDGAYSLPFLPSRQEASGSGPGCRLRTKVIPPSLVQDPRPGVSDVDRAKNTILSALLRMVECQDEEPHLQSQKRLNVDDFVVLSSMANTTNATQTNALYLETATQLGLMNDRAIPSLVSYLLPDAAPAATRRFLRRFLLTPPPPVVADAMHGLVAFLKDSASALPPLSVPPIGKVLALLRAGQASAEVYGDILRTLTGTILVLETFGEASPVVTSLMTLLEHESGMAADAESLRKRCSDAMDAIEDVISPVHHTRTAFGPPDFDRISTFGNLIPEAFFERNEAPWRGRVRREASSGSYERVEKAAETLAEAVAADFWGTQQELPEAMHASEAFEGKNPIVQDIFNNLFALRELPKNVDDDEASESKYIHPRDRFGKLLRNRYTTERVQDALGGYANACERAQKDVSSVLFGLSQRLHDEGHIPAVVQSSHSNLILSSAMYHAAKARSLGWNLAETYEPDPDVDSAGYYSDVWPYWIDRSEAVANSFELNGMWLLTAPNMAGKSTILRSTAAAALLSVCGLCAPVGPGSKVRRFDHIFVRGASSDVPSEFKSAFGAEMGDVAALLRCCGAKSLIFVDELGRGTSPRDGTRLAAAVLEEMALEGMSGIFATHLHDILELPLRGSDRIVKKRMAIHEHDSSGKEMPQYTWTYILEDGVCTDSMALVTALRFGLPQKVLDRADAFASFLPLSGLMRDAPITANGDSINHDGGSDGPPTVNGSLDDRVLRVVQSLTEERALSIPPKWTVPPSLEGESCVYVLQLGDSGRDCSYYVGETDNLRQRLKSHRSKGGDWSTARTYAVPVPGGKSDARSLESRLIQRLAREGIHLESIWDGRSVREQ